MAEIYDRLSAKFSESVIKQLSKGGSKLDYVPISEVIARMNAVLGIEGWGETDVQVWRDETDPEWVLARTTVWVQVGDVRTEKVGFGGQKIKKSGQGGPVDLGDEFKGAHSDAFKKACTKLGVALHLARDEAAIIQEAIDSEVHERSQAEPEGADAKDVLRQAIHAADPEKRQEIQRLWAEHRVPSIKEGADDKFTVEHTKLVASWLGVPIPNG